MVFVQWLFPQHTAVHGNNFTLNINYNSYILFYTEFQEYGLGTGAHYQAKRLFKSQCHLPMLKKCCDEKDLKPAITPKPTNLSQHHHSAHVSLILAQSNKSPRQHMTETHRKLMLDQWGPQERKDLQTKHFLRTEKSETEQNVVLDQVDELGCGDELAQGIDLDLVGGLEDEESMELYSDACSKRETDDNEAAEQIQDEQKAWGWTKNSALTTSRLSDAHLAPNGLSKQITGMLTGRLFHDKSMDKTFLERFYHNGIYTNGMFSNEDADEMFPDICDAGEALADKDGLSECDLFDHTDPLPAKNNGDVIPISIEEGSDSSVLSSSSIEEDEDEVQQLVEKMDEQGNNLSDISSSRHPSGDRLSVPDANEKCFSKEDAQNESADYDLKVTLNPPNSYLSLVQPETNNQTLTQNQTEDDIGREEEVLKNRETKQLDQTVITVEDLYEETEPIMQAKDFLQNRKCFMTRSISVETPSKNLDPTSSPATGNGRLLLHPRSFYTDHCFIRDSRPALTGSLGCLSQSFHTSANVNKMSKLDIPPPFELASITKRPIRKSSPSLSSEISATCKKPDFGLKRYLLPLRFLRKSERKSPTDNRSISSRSSSESSPQGSCKRLDFIRHNMGSPELHRTQDCTPPMSPSSFHFHKNRQKTGLNLMLHKDLASSTISIEPDNLFHTLFEPIPLSKPRSFSSPDADSSEYENITNTSSHYENVQIRLLNPVIQSQRNQGSSSDTDGYVDMSSLPSFQSKSQSEQETDR